ncbi:testis-specific zinc finger protein topi-like [Prorops nasuta]|uniref:testis-specific zinc finger protein topi-like n=1 Tax=Prorops nasuta TaxID=863751 RepID=UPI0034CE5468
MEQPFHELCTVVVSESRDFSFKEEKVLDPMRRRKCSIQDTGKHRCSKCSKSYMHAWHLTRHLKFECGQEPKIQCPYCSARMKQRGHVYRHIRRCHSGQNVYVIDLNLKNEKTSTTECENLTNFTPADTVSDAEESSEELQLPNNSNDQGSYVNLAGQTTTRVPLSV